MKTAIVTTTSGATGMAFYRFKIDVNALNGGGQYGLQVNGSSSDVKIVDCSFHYSVSSWTRSPILFGNTTGFTYSDILISNCRFTNSVITGDLTVGVIYLNGNVLNRFVIDGCSCYDSLGVATPGTGLSFIRMQQRAACTDVTISNNTVYGPTNFIYFIGHA